MRNAFRDTLDRPTATPRLNAANIERIRSLSAKRATPQAIALTMNMQLYTIHAVLANRITPIVGTNCYRCVESTFGNNPVRPYVKTDAEANVGGTPNVTARPPQARMTDAQLRAAFASHPLHNHVETSTLTLEQLAERIHKRHTASNAVKRKTSLAKRLTADTEHAIV